MLTSELIFIVMIQIFLFVLLLLIVMARTQGVATLRKQLDRIERAHTDMAELRRDLAFLSDRTANLAMLRQRIEHLERRSSSAATAPSIFSPIAGAATQSALPELNQTPATWESGATVSAQIEAELRRGRDSVTSQLSRNSAPKPADPPSASSPVPPRTPPPAPAAFTSMLNQLPAERRLEAINRFREESGVAYIDVTIFDLLQAGKKLEAIKQYHDKAGTSYPDSKVAIEAIIDRLSQTPLTDRP